MRSREKCTVTVMMTVTGSSAPRPVVMLNLLRFKERATAADEGLTGEEAYERYADEMIRFVESRGGRVVSAFRVRCMRSCAPFSLGMPGVMR